MTTITDLKNICTLIEEEFGSDAKVCIQFREDDGRLIGADYIRFMSIDAEGNLYLSNREKINN